MTFKTGSQDEKKLRQLYRSLVSADQQALLRYAEFLAASSVDSSNSLAVVMEPALIPRPMQESVVKAIKRLTASYPMLNADELLHPTTDLMSAHVIKGIPAPEIIDQLEALFADHYQKFKHNYKPNP